MAVLAYDNISRSGSGYIFAPALEGELELSFLELIFDDLDDDAFKPIINFQSPITYATTFERLLWINVFIEVIAGAELYPFRGTPEARYNLGTYSGITGYTVEEVNPGEFATTAIATPSSFLNYKILSLPPCWFTYSYPNANNIDYQVSFSAPTPDITPVAFFSSRKFENGQTPLQVPLYQGILLNLYPAVVANVSLYYTWENRNIVAGTAPDPGFLVFYPF